MEITNQAKLVFMGYETYPENIYYTAVVESPFGHYLAYAGVKDRNIAFYNVTNTIDAQKIAENLTGSINRKIENLRPITFSNSSFCEDIKIGNWWIGVDYHSPVQTFQGNKKVGMNGAKALVELLRLSRDKGYL